MQQGFKKSERLTSLKQIDALFKNGKKIYVHPLRVYYSIDINKHTHKSNKILFSVPKKNIKKAVDRNNIKRKMREAYRKNKSVYKKDVFLNLGFVYVETKIVDFCKIENSLIKILKLLS